MKSSWDIESTQSLEDRLLRYLNGDFVGWPLKPPQRTLLRPLFTYALAYYSGEIDETRVRMQVHTDDMSR